MREWRQLFTPAVKGAIVSVLHGHGPFAFRLGEREHAARVTNGLNLGRTLRNDVEQRARVGEGSAEFTSAEGGGACRPQGTGRLPAVRKRGQGS
jgi:hypothetical protein